MKRPRDIKDACHFCKRGLMEMTSGYELLNEGSTPSAYAKHWVVAQMVRVFG